jgi:asparagine synthase (glutamine-hydrolysing)
MLAYFAIVWDEDNPAASALRSRIALSLSPENRQAGGPGFALYDLSIHPKRSVIIDFEPGAAGAVSAVFGRLFSSTRVNGAYHAVTQLLGYSASRLERSGGCAVVTDFWGSYIAFVRGRGAFMVIADSTSSLPCFYTQQNGVALVFSHLEKCHFLDKSRFSVNYGFISKVLAYDKIQTGETGLNEVRELFGGQRLKISRDATTTDYVWDQVEEIRRKLAEQFLSFLGAGDGLIEPKIDFERGVDSAFAIQRQRHGLFRSVRALDRLRLG